MRKLTVLILAIAALAAFMVSCVSIQDGQMSTQERSQANVVGSVSAQFTSFQFFHRVNERNLTNRARIALTRAAQQQFGPNVEVRDISISGGASAWGALYGIGVPIVTSLVGGAYTLMVLENNPSVIGVAAGLFPLVGLNLIGNIQWITATGVVVQHGAVAVGSGLDYQRLMGAIDSAAQTLIDSIPQNSTMAILNVHSQDPAAAAFILDELEFRLVGSVMFTIVDRQRLEQIRLEQHFHLSGEVSDASAVSIGNMLGAGFVITGDIGTDLLGDRLMLRILDVNTGQIMPPMILERF
ncbi:MAG: penicillin-binding protein activator LpoB [Treponema sp.]|nr:penicillin-binding protein activator LpoB [Treponema sp.]